MIRGAQCPHRVLIRGIQEGQGQRDVGTPQDHGQAMQVSQELREDGNGLSSGTARKSAAPLARFRHLFRPGG